MRIRTRLQRLEQRARAVRVKPPEERPASGSFAHPDGACLKAAVPRGTAGGIVYRAV